LAVNQISSIESDDLRELSSLTTLSLQVNQITRIEPGAFSELSNLKTLLLKDNAALLDLNLDAANLPSLATAKK